LVQPRQLVLLSFHFLRHTRTRHRMHHHTHADCSFTAQDRL
jgi:hypothetical protein